MRQELTNDNYSYIKLYSMLNVEYNAIECITKKKEPTITFPIRHVAGAASLSFQEWRIRE